MKFESIFALESNSNTWKCNVASEKTQFVGNIA